jgi:hypothetical protein
MPQAKKGFEMRAEKLGVKIHNYHAENENFVDNAFVQRTKTMRQVFTYCGVYAHFQKCITEKISDLQD